MQLGIAVYSYKNEHQSSFITQATENAPKATEVKNNEKRILDLGLLGSDFINHGLCRMEYKNVSKCPDKGVFESL